MVMVAFHYTGKTLADRLAGDFDGVTRLENIDFDLLTDFILIRIGNPDLSFFLAKTKLQGTVAIRLGGLDLCYRTRTRFDNGHNDNLSAAIEKLRHSSFSTD